MPFADRLALITMSKGGTYTFVRTEKNHPNRIKKSHHRQPATRSPRCRAASVQMRSKPFDAPVMSQILLSLM